MEGIKIEQIINASGPVGSIERIRCIAGLDLGARTEAAKRVLARRTIRKEYMEKGFTPEQALSLSLQEVPHAN